MWSWCTGPRRLTIRYRATRLAISFIKSLEGAMKVERCERQSAFRLDVLVNGGTAHVRRRSRARRAFEICAGNQRG